MRHSSKLYDRNFEQGLLWGDLWNMLLENLFARPFGHHLTVTVRIALKHVPCQNCQSPAKGDHQCRYKLAPCGKNLPAESDPCFDMIANSLVDLKLDRYIEFHVSKIDEDVLHCLLNELFYHTLLSDDQKALLCVNMSGYPWKNADMRDMFKKILA